MAVFWYGPTVNASYGVRQDLAEATARSSQAHNDVAELESRLDRAMLACEAMWTLLSEKLSVSEEELVQRIQEIDLRDGKLDGKYKRNPVACPKCKRTISPRFIKCMYCGQPVQPDPFA